MDRGTAMTAPFDLFGYRKPDGNAEARIQRAIVEYVRLVIDDARKALAAWGIETNEAGRG
jgi:hypothetical protein